MLILESSEIQAFILENSFIKTLFYISIFQVILQYFQIWKLLQIFINFGYLICGICQIIDLENSHIFTPMSLKNKIL